MFELSVALKYLLPRWRQLSVSIIALISTFVISLVVWLILVFFSVTDGLEKGWIERLVALTAPVRLTPTDAYYHSYYHQVDAISSSSDFSSKSLHEKLLAEAADPYNPQVDMEIPRYWPLPDRDGKGEVRDLVKDTFDLLRGLQSQFPALVAADYEVTFGNIRLRQVRSRGKDYSGHYEEYQNFINQASYLSSFEPHNPRIADSILPLEADDLANLLELCAYNTDNALENNPDNDGAVSPSVLRNRLSAFFSWADVTQLKTRFQGWRLPSMLIPQEGTLKAAALLEGRHLNRVVIPAEERDLPELQRRLRGEGYRVEEATLRFSHDGNLLQLAGGETHTVSGGTPLIVEGNVKIPAELQRESLDQATSVQSLKFKIRWPLQTLLLQGVIPYGDLTLGETKVHSEGQGTPLWLHPEKEQLVLPYDDEVGEGVLLAKGYRETGARLGDRGYLSYYSPTASSVQEQRLPIFVAGFYDPGIIPLGGKFIVVNREVTSTVRAAYDTQDDGLGNGINVWIGDVRQAPEARRIIQERLQQAGLSPYWKVETYREFDFTRDIIQQLQSEKNLFSLIALIIILVACSNIISMLIILVNDKKMEIGILRSMGATSRSIATIFGTCGFIMGLLGSLLGTVAALFTLRHLKTLIDMLSALQGHQAFNKMLFGDSLPNELSLEALTFVLVATAFTSLLAGLVPAVKASLMRPSAILRSE